MPRFMEIEYQRQREKIANLILKMIATENKRRPLTLRELKHGIRTKGRDISIAMIHTLLSKMRIPPSHKRRVDD